MNIELKAETVAHLGGFPVTNTLLTSWLTLVVLVVVSLLFFRSYRLLPSRTQQFLEMIVEGILKLMEAILGERVLAIRYFPLVATIFLFVLASNWLGVLPGVGSIFVGSVHEGKQVQVPLFRSTYSDLNMTLALGLLTVFVTHAFALRTIGVPHIVKFINFENPISFFVGILEFVGEIAKVISFSFRLFGNIFAGEVLLTIVAALLPFLAPLPFLGLELFVGFVQAFIFATLTTVFLKVALTHELSEASVPLKSQSTQNGAKERYDASGTEPYAVAAGHSL